MTNIVELTVTNEWTANLDERSTIQDSYNQTKIYLESPVAKINLICRTYNKGMAFAYELTAQFNLTNIEFDDELVTYRFAENHSV